MNESKTSSDIYIGQLLNNRYLIRNLLGAGGMGRVYLAEDVTKECMLVAVKMLSLSIGNKHLAERFGREIFIGAQLGKKSPHITRVFTYGITNERVPFYVMEYLRGNTIKQILKVESLTILRFLVMCQQICLGLHCAHQGVTLNGKVYPIIHRDIKPENIFINNNGKKTEIVKILDFGIAKFLTESSGMTMTESFIGSLPYSSPEHMQGQKILDVRSDIYSLGVLMFEMLTRKHPFHTTSHSFSTWCKLHCIQAPPTFEEVNPHVSIPQELQQLVMRCLAKDVNDRPQSVKEILDDLVKIKAQIEQYPSHDGEKLQPEHNVKIVPLTSISEQECWQKQWPKNKPVGLICFPHLLHTPKGNILTLWAMLPQAEIRKLKEKIHTTEFISKIEDYPMILWVTMLYDEQSDLIRWLSYYLDIKDNKEEKILRNLAGIGYYHLLLFAREDPHKCSHVMTFMLTAKQRQYLSDAINLSQNKNFDKLTSSHQAKILLKIEYEKLKSQISKKLNTKSKKPGGFFKSWLVRLFDLFKS
ncbi:serine/threonine protein kinase [Anabaena sphaerica FACHB-251]|uniref:Serine/threonine protein kinase n=1 Tax=Anabaena sphaerica FACHB-251 TaxID=2692883 RepID=A0A927A086_9NOST|nr:serine/threonine-protein kinase [Anabaena sphaerica]MBD2291965.1 serine/threonine protein kinase [Anabaena sphaerica FACHB-251]